MDRTATLTTAFLALAATLALVLSGQSVRAQQPSPDQIAAVRASCRSDFMANCSGVQPGGKDALECLKRNLAVLSGSCKTAVSAIGPAPAAAPATAAAPTIAAAPAASAPSPAPAVTATPTPAKPVPLTAPKPVPRPVAKLTAPAPPAATAPPTSPPPPTVAPLNVRPFILPRRRVAIVAICSADARTLCPGVPPGGGRILDCLAEKASSLSPNCYDAIARVSR